ncbi:Hypothetical protein GLP15_1845 [Giardia lamblia P15]|uniref:Uncharacterized protein n=1 Tax=Giardia intestinalis (strain P15) TaxID=658858 RepID=E1F2B6_GIAIA|nr:Hypothetical protein GLP15_1845 [Giardia lamblia P15]
MDSSCAPIQLVDVVSPTLQGEERTDKGRITDVPSEAESKQSYVTAKISTRSPSCESSKTRKQKDSHVLSVYAQRHRSTPSRKRKIELCEPVASPLRMVLTQSISSPEDAANVTASILKENVPETSDYALINMKKESLRKLLAELSTSPRSTANGLLSPGYLRAESLRVSPMKNDATGTSTTVQQITKTSIALSPLLPQPEGNKEQESKVEMYVTRIAQLEEMLQQRELEMKELMMVVLSNDLLKTSSDSDKVAALTEQLRCKENELRQMIEFLADEQKRKEEIRTIAVQTDQQSDHLPAEKNQLYTVASKRSVENLCPRCRAHERLLEDGDNDGRSSLAIKTDKNSSRGPSKKQVKGHSKDALTQAKSVPVRRTRSVASTPLQNTKRSGQSSKNIHILEQLLQSPKTDMHELSGAQALPLAQFALSPPASVTDSSIAHSPAEFYPLEEQLAPSQYFLNTSVSAVSDTTYTPDLGSKADPSAADPLFDAVFSILTGIAK